MNQNRTMRYFGFLLLAGAICQQGRATQIIIVNSGTAGNTSSYYNSYDSTSGYTTNNQGGGVTSSTGTAPGLTSNTLSGSVTDPSSNFGRLAFADSTVSASLATGEIKISEDTGPCYTTGIPGCGGSVNSAGTITENLTFHNTTGAPATIGFAFRATLDATVQAVPAPNGTIYSVVRGSTTFAVLGGKITYDFSACGLLDCGGLDGSRTGGFDSLTVSPSGNFGAAFYATATINPGDTSTLIFENFNPVCSAGATCDGTHTAAVVFNLPTGVTFDSESGIFLSQASAVPEPSTWIFVSLGVLGLAAKKGRG